MNKIKNAKTKFYKACENCYNAIKEIVADNGGFILTSPSLKCDLIYGYVYNDNGDFDVEEKVCYGICVENDVVLVYLEDNAMTYTLDITKEDMLADNENWYRLDGLDGITMKVPTLGNIIENISEYV